MSAHSSKPSSFLTTTQAARLLGVHAASISRWANQGRIRAIRTLGGHRRIPVAEVERLISQNASCRIKSE